MLHPHRGHAEAVACITWLVAERAIGEVLFAYLLRLTADWQLAEEILQDVLVTAWRRAASFEGRSRASAPG